MDLDANELFKEPYPLEDTVLDIDTPKPQRAITSLPDDFQIRTMSDIRTLQEYAAFNYTKGIRLYRGHESKDYKMRRKRIARFKIYLMPKRKVLICFAAIFSKKNGCVTN